MWHPWQTPANNCSPLASVKRKLGLNGAWAGGDDWFSADSAEDIGHIETTPSHAAIAQRGHDSLEFRLAGSFRPDAMVTS
jgi:hypothetical protein